MSRAVDSTLPGYQRRSDGVSVGPAERRVRPQRRREPRVEHVGRLLPAVAVGPARAGRRSCRRARTRPAAGGPTTAGARCTRAGSTPSSRRRSSRAASGGTRMRPLRTASIAVSRELVHLAEPLQRDERLDARAGALAEADGVAQRLLAQRSGPRRAAAATARSWPSSSERPVPLRACRSRSRPCLVHERAASARPWSRPISKSVGSWPGVTFSAPVPKSISTRSSPMIGTGRSTSGTIARAPDQVRASAGRPGARRRAVSARIVTGRTVAITISPPPSTS